MTIVHADQRWATLCTRAFRAPWLSEQRERELLQRARADDERAKRELCDCYLRLVVQIVSRYRRANIATEDLVSEGCLGLLEAMRRFDLSKQCRLGTYAAWWIKAYVRRYFHANRGLVQPPSTRGVRVALARAGRAERQLRQSLGRPPTRSDLAEALHVRDDDVAVFETAGLRAVPLCPYDGADVRDETPDAEEQCLMLDLVESRSRAVRSCVAALEERDREIVQAHFLEESASLAELGERLGVSRQRVSQIAKRVRAKLMDELTQSAPELWDVVIA